MRGFAPQPSPRTLRNEWLEGANAGGEAGNASPVRIESGEFRAARAVLSNFRQPAQAAAMTANAALLRNTSLLITAGAAPARLHLFPDAAVAAAVWRLQSGAAAC